MIVLIAGTILGSVLIPMLQTNADRAQLRREQRLRLAIVMLEHNSTVNAELNVLQSVLESYVKDVVGNVDSSEAIALRRELQERLHQHYDRFNLDAWWWADDIRSQAVTLGLVTESERSRMETAAEHYRRNLNAATTALEQAGLWRLPYRAGPMSSDVRSRVLRTRILLDSLRVERTTILSELCSPLVEE